MSFWAVVQTETQREHIARLLLMRLGYETYAPRIKIKQRVALLFPSYVFCRVIDRWYPILWTPGVLRVLMSGERPAALNEKIITSLRRREFGGFVKLPSKSLRRGTKLKVIRGPFEGHIVLHDGMTGADRQRVLLAALGQDVTLELPKKDLVVLPGLAVFDFNASRYTSEIAPIKSITILIARRFFRKSVKSSLRSAFFRSASMGATHLPLRITRRATCLPGSPGAVFPSGWALVRSPQSP